MIDKHHQMLIQIWKAQSNFILRVHGLSLESPQVSKWSRELLPERTLGCGFCVQYFETFEERFQHVASHFEQGWRKESWSRSTVILSLLAQPGINSDWQFLRSRISGPCTISDISWPESSSTDSLQRRLESDTERGRDLALEAYKLSSLCGGGTKRIGLNQGMEILPNSNSSIHNHADPLDLFPTDTM